MKLKNSALLFSVCVFAAANLAASSASSRESCKVTISVTNRTNDTIRIYRVGVYDKQAKKWRHENLNNTTVGKDQTRREKAILAGIGGETFRINLHYRVLESAGKWSKMKKSPIRNKSACSDNSTVSIVIG